MNKKVTLFFFIFSILSYSICRSALPDVNIFVSQDGLDSNPGSFDLPFHSLERARTAIREIKINNGNKLPGCVTVYMRKGTYRLKKPLILEESDSGSSTAIVCYKAFPGEEVRLSGGISIPSSSVEKGSINSTGSDESDNQQEQIRMIDLRRVGVNNLSKFAWNRVSAKEVAPAPFTSFAEPTAPEELFINDKPMTLARWPNEGWALTGPVLKKIVSINAEDQAFIVTAAKLDQWNNPDIYLEGFWQWDWFDEAIPVKSVNSKLKIVTLSKSHYYGIAENRRYFAFNIISELDKKGEYYIDRENSVLYFIAPEGGEIENIVLSYLDTPLIQLYKASYIVFEGFILEAGRDSGIIINGGTNNRINKCTVRNFGNTGVIINGGSAHELMNSELYNLGTRGVVVGGGNRENLNAGLHKVNGNNIHHFQRRINTLVAGVEILGVGNEITGNRIHDAPHIGIYIHGNDHKIEFNEIYLVCSDTSDAGAIYIGRDWTERGNIIRNNYIHDIQGMFLNSDVTAIYLDDFASEIFICKNIIVNVFRGVLIGGGRNNTVDNNFIVSTVIPISLDARGTGWAKESVEKGGIMQQKLKRMPYNKTPWSIRYPALVQILEDEPGLPKGNNIIKNAFVESGEIKIEQMIVRYNTILYNEHINQLNSSNIISPTIGKEYINDKVRKSIRNWSDLPITEIVGSLSGKK